MNTPPLVIDLDGTLLRSDLLLESGLLFLRSRPTRALLPLKWLLSGKVHLKEQLAKSTPLDVAHLPYDPEVIAFIKEEKAKGRVIVLATASHKIYAEQVAAHLNLFDHIFATETVNLSATAKRDLLVKEYGQKGFDYAGNSHDDLPVLAAARHAYLVNPQRGLHEKAEALGNLSRVIQQNVNSLKVWTKALRLHQWLKNILIFIPLLASHQITSTHLLLNSLLAFVLFGLCASGVYLFNDLLDLADDRNHATKRHRPFASGQLPILAGLYAVPSLFIVAFTGALTLLPWKFAMALEFYFALTLLYCLLLKKKTVADVIALAMLYTMRIIAGVYACGLNLTFWMLAFSMFIFLSLALVKRYAELAQHKPRGRGIFSRRSAHGRSTWSCFRLPFRNGSCPLHSRPINREPLQTPQVDLARLPSAFVLG